MRARLLVLLCGFSTLVPAQVIERQVRLSDPTLVEMQEVLTTVRTVFDIRELRVLVPSDAFTVRGPAGAVAGIEWLVHDLESPADIRDRAAHQFVMAGEKQSMVRVLYLKSDASPQYVQEMLTTLRTVLDIQKAFNVTRYRAIVVRGTPEQIEMSAWITGEIDGAAQPRGTAYSGVHQFRPGATLDDVVRVFYPDNKDLPNFANVVKPLRTQLNQSHLFLFTAPEALVIRGTTDQIERAEKFIGTR